MDKKQTDLIIMYYEIKRLRNDEKLSIQRIADFLGMNFRTVRKYLEMPENEFEVYMTTIGDRPYIMDPYKQFIINYLNESTSRIFDAYPDMRCTGVERVLHQFFYNRCRSLNHLTRCNLVGNGIRK